MATTLDNFVRSVLATDATAADTQLVLAKAAAPLRDPPAATEDAPGIIVLQDVPSAPAKIEIVRYTGRAIVGNQVTLTGVTRAQEGTTAQSWTAGTPTLQGITAGLIAQKMDTGDTADAATKLADARTFALAGLVTAAAVSFDGTANVALTTSIADGALTFAKVSGLQTALDAKMPKSGGTFTGAVAFNERPIFDGATPWDSTNLAHPVRNTTSNDVFFAWGSNQLGITIDTTFQGYLWHSGNFDPGNYAALSGATFTGPVVIGGGTDMSVQLNPVGGRMYRFASTASGNAGIYNVTSTRWAMRLDASDNLYIQGNASAPDFIATSDPRLKDRVRPLLRGMESLKQMRPREYVKYDTPEFRGPGKPEVGFLTTEVEKALPEAKIPLPNGYDGVSYGQVTALLASALLEVDDRLAKLEGH
ncbi:tail fiber domain-containing protein [Luteibacter yeojuensis]|uniref:Tail fiber domain-containing protein n=1 Tax=Luteibacter yeojuensis TaxID=345309 RepID=A0A7X5TPN4_9GAMM|nr:tail fiber domain-containing protein [Luteibacter yeojuensis]NID14973.1 tail fiber domain-containing protein [Luteibacter yeojuensis]